jgi:hypothetical protein
MLASCVLDWLELPGHGDLMKGKAQQKMKSVESSTTKLTKAAGYKSMADYVNAKLHLKWTAKEAKSRFESLKKKYTEAHKALNDISGKKFGLSEKELKQGLTIQQKLEKLCHGYYRWDAIFGDRENLKPSYIAQSTDSTSSSSSSSSDDDDSNCTVNSVSKFVNRARRETPVGGQSSCSCSVAITAKTLQHNHQLYPNRGLLVTPIFITSFENWIV